MIGVSLNWNFGATISEHSCLWHFNKNANARFFDDISLIILWDSYSEVEEWIIFVLDTEKYHVNLTAIKKHFNIPYFLICRLVTSWSLQSFTRMQTENLRIFMLTSPVSYVFNCKNWFGHFNMFVNSYYSVWEICLIFL